MLLAAIIVLVGVTSAQVLSTTMTPPRSTNLTTFGATQPTPNTVHSKPTSTSGVPIPLSTPAEPSLTTLMEEMSSGDTSTIPFHSTLRSLSKSSPMETSTIKIATSPFTLSTHPSSTRRPTLDTTRSTRHFPTLSSIQTNLKVPSTTFSGLSLTTNAVKISSQAAEDFSVTSTNFFHLTSPYFVPTYKVPTDSSIRPPFQISVHNEAKNMTPTDNQRSTLEINKKLVTTFNVSPNVLQKPTTPKINTTFENATATDTQHQKPMNGRSSPLITSPALPVPTAPLSSEVQRPTIIPPNTVESMHHLPGRNQETTSVFSENEFINVLRPTLPSLFSRKPTKPFKTRPRIVKKPTTSAPRPTLPSLKPNERRPDYYKYKTSVSSQTVTSTSVVPKENLSSLRTPSYPIGGPLVNSPVLPHFPLETIVNQSVFHSTALPIEDASIVPKIPANVPYPQKTSSETWPPPEILPTLAAMDSDVIENLTQNCTNDYCVSDEDYIDMMLEYMFPTSYEWVLIGMHIIVFIGGLVGNALVCAAVYRNHSMRTVTNYFIVNLAVADFLVILLCLPPTVLWDVTETWFMGTALCKIVLYFQTVSVAVSVLTLTFISVDRWYAICCPLKFKSTTSRAKTAILVIWVLALAFDIPELVVLETKRKELSVDTLFFTQCEPSWSDKTDMAFHCLQTVLLYTLPLVFMSIAYCQIVRVLWSSSNIPGHKERLNSSVSNGRTTSCRGDTIDRRKTMNRSISVTVSTTGQVISRRKAAKMLVAVVVMFAVCYFPVHLLSILRYTLDIPQTDATTVFAMVSHWLCYANSAVNPLIYNFMCGKFRKEFALTFGCRRISWRRPAAFARRHRRHRVACSGEWGANGQCGTQRAEMVPLSGGCSPNTVLDVEIPC